MSQGKRPLTYRKHGRDLFLAIKNGPQHEARQYAPSDMRGMKKSVGARIVDGFLMLGRDEDIGVEVLTIDPRWKD